MRTKTQKTREKIIPNMASRKTNRGVSRELTQVNGYDEYMCLNPFFLVKKLESDSILEDPFQTILCNKDDYLVSDENGNIFRYHGKDFLKSFIPTKDGIPKNRKEAGVLSVIHKMLYPSGLSDMIYLNVSFFKRLKFLFRNNMRLKVQIAPVKEDRHKQVTLSDILFVTPIIDGRR